MKEKRNLLMGVGLISAFALCTVLIQCVNVQAVGQIDTKIGLADRKGEEFDMIKNERMGENRGA